LIAAREFEQVKRELPEAFVQRRIVCTNYKTLRNIVMQRATHRLGEWQVFCEALLEQLAHPVFIVEHT
jgi:thymidylate synthase ThyX